MIDDCYAKEFPQRYYVPRQQQTKSAGIKDKIVSFALITKSRFLVKSSIFKLNNSNNVKITRKCIWLEDSKGLISDG